MHCLNWIFKDTLMTRFTFTRINVELNIVLNLIIINTFVYKITFFEN